MGRKIAIFLTLLGALFSCGISEIGGGQGTTDDVWHGPGNVVVGSGSGSEPGVGKKAWYAVGVDYPQGYDWRADLEEGSVRCSLVVFVNGVPLMKLPVGDKYEVSDDPDMHRMIGGSLYTDFSTESETVIKRNGEPLFRYPGREMIVGMVVEKDLVYTLGQSRDGGGFSFRVNGEELLFRSDGYVFPHLQRCEDGFSFSFCETIGSGDNAKECYYHYFAGEICQVAVREDIKKVWDIKYHDEKLCYLASLVGISEPVLAVGSVLNPLSVPANTDVKSCRFVSEFDGLDIEGMMSQRRKLIFSGLWKNCDLVKVFPSGYTVASHCAYDEELCCVLNASNQSKCGIIYRSGEMFDVPEGYMSMGGRTMVVVDGMLYVGLTSETSESPAVWVENEMKPLKINGFISHISSD